MIAIKKVLVATDFSPVSETALVYGRALARTFDGTLHVLHVVEDLASRFSYADPAVVGFGPEQLQADLEHTARAQLEAAVSETDRRELHAVPVFRVGNSPAKQICEYATEAAIDVIVIGATGRGAVDRMLMGSVADKVVRHAPCPVLAVRAPEHEFVLPDALQVVAHAND
jgi:nucleotide-binding universal stress UspA family protein